jgi:sirohydrochlorin cobaltochelatase
MHTRETGILVVSFGTSYRETMKKTICACEDRIAESFPECEVRRAFTSYRVIDKLKARDGLQIDNPEEALGRMKEEGFTRVVVQPLHILPGAEFHNKVLSAVQGRRDSFETHAVGCPLLCSEQDYYDTAGALREQFPPLAEGQAVVLMGHGTSHPANTAYSCLQLVFEEFSLPVYIGTVEGFPTISYVLKKLKNSGIRDVFLMPFMLVAGEHVLNDMTGESEDSWKKIFEKNGYPVSPLLLGLGENRSIQDIYVRHVREAMKEMEGQNSGK